MHEEGLDDLMAQTTITRLLHLYARGVDRLDRELLISIAHPTTTIEFTGMFSGKWADYVDWLLKAHTSMLYNRHTISNVLIEVDGDKAVSEALATASLVVKRDDGKIEDRTTHARYLDTWRKEQGRWWLAQRLTMRDRREIITVTPEELAATNVYVHAADVGRKDPSYAHLERSTQAW